MLDLQLSVWETVWLVNTVIVLKVYRALIINQEFDFLTFETLIFAYNLVEVMAFL